MKMEINGINIDFLGHAGFLIRNNAGIKIAIDPYNISANVDEKVDLILITHNHYDHCSIKDITRLAKKGCVVVVPADAQSKITKIEDIEMQIIENSEEFKFGNIKVEAVAAYNVNKDFHPKSEGWLGYVVKMGNVIIYHAGDSDKIPEMKKLTGYGKKENKFIALLPVSGKYVMDAEEAVEVASLINPLIAIPMHYGAGVVGSIKDAENFVELCKEIGLRAEILKKI